MTRVIVYFQDSRKVEVMLNAGVEDVAGNFQDINDDRIVALVDKDGDIIIINWNQVTYAFCYDEDREGGENDG